MYLQRNPHCCCRTNQNTRFIYFLALSTVLFHLHYKEKGPKCYFNGSFYRLPARAACPRCCLHLGLCLRSQTEGYLADKASRGVWNMFYRCREGDLLFRRHGTGVCDTVLNRNLYSLWSLHAHSLAMGMHEGAQT